MPVSRLTQNTFERKQNVTRSQNKWRNWRAAKKRRISSRIRSPALGYEDFPRLTAFLYALDGIKHNFYVLV
jgi:hypothetical protein